jgi:hypothetical protein
MGSVSVLADGCRERLIHPNWPNDRLEMGLSCTRVKTVLGRPENGYEKLCFGIVKTEISDFKGTWYETYRYAENRSGGNLTIGNMDEFGDVRDGYVSQDGSLLEVGVAKSSFEFGQKWVDETVVDLANGSELAFNSYDKGWFTQTLKSSTIYSCKRIQ